MKGLILKDIYEVKFQVTMSLIIMLIPNVCALFIPQNLALTKNMSDLILILLHASLNYVNINLFSTFVLNTADSNIKSGWQNIAATFPVSRRVLTGAKMISTGIVVAVLTAVSLVFNIIACIMSELPAEPMIALPICIGILQAGILFPAFPIARRVGKKVSGALYLTAEIIIAISAVVLCAVTLDSSDPSLYMRIISYGGVPAATALSAGLSYAFSNR